MINSRELHQLIASALWGKHDQSILEMRRWAQQLDRKMRKCSDRCTHCVGGARSGDALCFWAADDLELRGDKDDLWFLLHDPGRIYAYEKCPCGGRCGLRNAETKNSGHSRHHFLSHLFLSLLFCSDIRKYTVCWYVMADFRNELERLRSSALSDQNRYPDRCVIDVTARHRHFHPTNNVPDQ